MSLLTSLRKLLRQIALGAIGPFVWGGIILYFTYYAIYGDRGLMAMRQLQVEKEQAQARLDEVRNERVRLENRTALLRSDHLDPDLLDEQVRKMLNYSNPDDIVIMLPKHEEAPSPAPTPQTR
jgi:cell division protein FtsB